MKKYLLLVAIPMLLLTGCQKIDTSKMPDFVKKIVMSKEEIKQEEEKLLREEQVAHAQKVGYPNVWTIYSLPKYPNGNLIKVDNKAGLAVLETDDSAKYVVDFFNKEMGSLEFTNKKTMGTDLNTIIIYAKEDHTLNLQAAQKHEDSITKIVLNYNEGK